MKRACKHIASSKDGKRSIYIDSENGEEILKYLRQDNRHLKKFQHISTIILEGHKNCELYDKEDVSDKAKDVTAMKFFKGQENDRIYCKEISTPLGVKIVVASVLYLRKKNSKLTVQQKKLIETVGSYQYEIR